MKRLLLITVGLAGLMSMFSCTKVLYPHQTVMQSFHTKEAVAKQFGAPDEKRVSDKTEEWLYNCDSTSVFTLSGTKVDINGVYNGVLNERSITVDEFKEYLSYIKFTFDAKGTVINWTSKGVDFSKRVPARGRTALLVGGSIAVAAIILRIAVINSLNDSFQGVGAGLGQIISGF
jgi:hypothetical protein